MPVNDDKLKYTEIMPFQAGSDNYCQANYVRIWILTKSV